MLEKQSDNMEQYLKCWKDAKLHCKTSETGAELRMEDKNSTLDTSLHHYKRKSFWQFLKTWR